MNSNRFGCQDDSPSDTDDGGCSDLRQYQFVDRKKINEFLIDGELISGLYHLLQNLLFVPGINADSVKKSALRILNNAYEICWQITDRKADFREVTSRVVSCDGVQLQFLDDLTYFCVWTILTVYRCFYDFDDSILQALRNYNESKPNFCSFRELVRMQEEPEAPIGFRCPYERSKEQDAALSEISHSVVVIDNRLRTLQMVFNQTVEFFAKVQTYFLNETSLKSAIENLQERVNDLDTSMKKFQQHLSSTQQQVNIVQTNNFFDSSQFTDIHNNNRPNFDSHGR